MTQDVAQVLRCLAAAVVTFRRSWLKSPKDDGGVIVVMIWVLGLIALIAATFTSSTQPFLSIASVASEQAQLEAAADAGVHLALVDLVAARGRRDHQRQFPVRGIPVVCRWSDDTTLTISVEDEEGKLNINGMQDDYFRVLLIGAGASESESDRMIAAWRDFIDNDDNRRLDGAEREDYQRQGLSGPKNSLIDETEELADVLGFSRSLVEKLGPVLTVYSQRTDFDPAVAKPKLNSLLERSLKGTQFLHTVGTPHQSRRRYFTVHVTAVTKAGFRFEREAVADLAPIAEAPFRLLAWRRGDAATGQLEHPDVAENCLRD